MFTFVPPASKSLTNRALILASLANGKSIIHNFSNCDDTKYLIKGLRKLGVKIKIEDNTLLVEGNGGDFNKNNIEIYCGNAGTTFRFLAGLLVLNKGKVTLSGSKRMQQRPIEKLLHALEQIGANVETVNGFPPVTIDGGKLVGLKKQNNIIYLDASISSQFLSSLLLILPVLPKDTKIVLTSDLPSKPYIKMTIDILKKFGVIIKNRNFKEFYLIKQSKIVPTEITIENDASSATYFLGAAAILKKSIKVIGLNKNSFQADLKFINVLEKMGCKVKWLDNSVILRGSRLKKLSVDMKNFPDSVPTLAVIAMFAEGKTKIRNIENLRYKESDRISDLARELRKVGAKVKEGKDFLEIIPSSNYNPAKIKTYKDHRLAMAFALASLKIGELKILDPSCVNKSFPEFWTEFNKMKEYYKL